MKKKNVSTKAQETFLEICHDPTTKLVDWNQFMVLLNDWALWTGHKKQRIFWDLVTSRGGRHVSGRIEQEFFLKRLHYLSVEDDISRRRCRRRCRRRRNAWSVLRL
jgi:hypothetical protein